MAQLETCVGAAARAVAGQLLAATASVLLAIHGAGAEPVRLSTGEVLDVTVVRLTDAAIVATHPVLGRLVLPRAQAELLGGQASGSGEPSPGNAREPEPVATEPVPLPPPAVEWKRSISIGLSGTEGNAESASGRVGLDAKRTSPAQDTVLAAGYFYATSDGNRTRNRADAAIRNDWKFGDSRWGLFAQGRVEYDEFQDWDLRLSGSLGPSYQVVRTETTSLRGRAGLGLRREFGGESNSLTPEAIFGLDFEHKVSERTVLTAGVEWLPSLAEVPQFRAGGHMGMRTVLDAAAGMSLHAGIADRYDSSPGASVDRNDIEYFVTLGWQF